MLKYLERLISFKGLKEKMEHYYDMANARSEGREEGESIGFERGETVGFERGETAGLEKGKALGQEENQVETATTMLKEGLAPELVQKCTKLPWEKIKHIMTLL